MSKDASSLPALLVLSGIDLLLAALCAAMGILVLLIGSARGAGEQKNPAVDGGFADWTWIRVTTGSYRRHSLICDGIPSMRRSMGSEAIYFERRPTTETWTCTLSLADRTEGKAAVITLESTRAPSFGDLPVSSGDYRAELSIEGIQELDLGPPQ